MERNQRQRITTYDYYLGQGRYVSIKTPLYAATHGLPFQIPAPLFCGVQGVGTSMWVYGHLTVYRIPIRFCVGTVMPMSFARLVVLALAVLAVLADREPVRAQTPSLETVLARAADYVSIYQQDLGNIIADEEYTQAVDPGRTRRMYSELLVFSPPDDERWLVFRDVIEVDGKPVEDREQRLAVLFQETPDVPAALELKLRTESARFNIGFISRDLNVPTMALQLLTNRERSRLVLEKTQEELLGDLNTWVIAFQAVDSPALIQDAQRQDLLSHGTFWIEPATGRVLQTDFLVEDEAIGLTIEIRVRYQLNEAMGMLVPATMTEHYGVDVKVQPSQSTTRGPTVSAEIPSQRQFFASSKMTIRCKATYSNYRRFGVDTGFNILPPGR